MRSLRLVAFTRNMRRFSACGAREVPRVQRRLHPAMQCSVRTREMHIRLRRCAHAATRVRLNERWFCACLRCMSNVVYIYAIFDISVVFSPKTCGNGSPAVYIATWFGVQGISEALRIARWIPGTPPSKDFNG